MKKITSLLTFTIIYGLLSVVPLAAAVASKHAPAEPDISILWILPFVGILLSIAIIPLISSHFWEKNMWWISLGVFCLPMAVIFSVFMGEKLRELAFEKALEYISFIILLGSLYIISGGILIKGAPKGTPFVNTVFLLIGSLFASFVGTTGASMLLIRPVIRANSHRVKKYHIVLFFIFLVSNIGGLLTPLGDPPLFLGYLQGVPFEWTFRLFPQWIVATSAVLIVFFIFDSIMHKWESRESGGVPAVEALFGDDTCGKGDLVEVKRDLESTIMYLDVDYLVEQKKIGVSLLRQVKKNLIEVMDKLDRYINSSGSMASAGGIQIVGKINFILLAGVVACIFFQGVLVKRLPGLWPHFGPQEAGMAIFAGISLILSPPKSETRMENGFTFGPIKEVAIIFAGIFAAMIPALYILQKNGAALGITKPWQFFWASGSLSSFLDNAPTYLTFLSVAKGLNLQNDLGFVLNDGTGLSAVVLTAISCGAVFMGANSYIGNGPNFMVKSIAEENGIKMPSFFGYMIYSGCILIPVFILITFIFFV